MDLSQKLIVTGLIIDIIGVLILFFHENPRPEYGVLLESAPSEDDRRRSFSKKRIMSRIALGILAVGFLFQIAGTIMS